MMHSRTAANDPAESNHPTGETPMKMTHNDALCRLIEILEAGPGVCSFPDLVSALDAAASILNENGEDGDRILTLAYESDAMAVVLANRAA